MMSRDATLVAAVDLPVPLTRFVGRRDELDDLARLLEARRLVTLTGAGGSGKTRLAREAARLAASRFERVAWVDLAPLGDATLLAERVALALRIPEQGGAPVLEAVVQAIGERRLLLVLDNCEHLVDGCAVLAETLLCACPGLVVLATSREALGVTSETAWLVPPLASTEAVQLFADRAEAACPSFALTDGNAAAVAEICQRLDGIPLAIELAAARVRVLPPEQIARRLDDAFALLTAGSRTALPRHRTLRATMEWSHALLGAREQALLRRLSVFAGGFSLGAAEAICVGGSLETDDILDGISALVDKSLVVMTQAESDARYRLLETVRQYGLERLAEAGERETYERRHVEHFLELAERTAPLLFGGEAVPGTIARLAADDDNLRAAAARTVRDEASAPLALRFADALFWYWYGSTTILPGGQYREGRRFVEAALARGAACPPDLRARALISHGLIGLATGDYATSTGAFTEALALVRGTGDAAREAFVRAKLGATRLMSGDLDGARALLAEAAAAVEPMPRAMIHAFVWFWHGWTELARGDLAAARRLVERHLALGEALDHRTTRGHSHAVAGGLELAEGRLEEAHAHFSAALPFHLELGDAWGLMLDLEGFAAVAAARRRYADAARLLGASDALRERTAVAVPATARAQREALLARLREKLGGEALARWLAEGGALPMDEVVQLTTNVAPGHTAEFQVVAVADAAHAAQQAAEAARPGRRPCRPRLRVLALGALQVFVDEQPVEAVAWGSARPRELLVYLLLHPDGRTKEQVGLAFWPDASATQLRNNFHVTLHRLRKALGCGDLIGLAAERYVVDPALVAEFDVEVFEREMTAARRALKRQEAGAAAQLEQALARFRGDLLDGEPAGDWHLEHRDRLQRLYVDGLMALGDQLAREERHERAAEAYRRVLARDELHEEAIRALMRCHAAAGERTQALRVYQRFADRLRRELEAEPDAATLRLHASLQRGAAV